MDTLSDENGKSPVVSISDTITPNLYSFNNFECFGGGEGYGGGNGGCPVGFGSR